LLVLVIGGGGGGGGGGVKLKNKQTNKPALAFPAHPHP
jgi:hypothetical protein